MTWVKIDDAMPEHPKVVGLSDAAFRVHISAICYAARNETDGRVSAGAVRQFRWQRRVRELVEARLWDPTEDGFAIHDYLDYNPSREQVAAERKASRKRLERWRKRDSNGVCNAVTNVAPDPDPDPDLSVSVPPTPHRTGLTEAQERMRVMLHARARDHLLGGVTAPKVDWCEDLIRRGLTESDVDVGVQASLGKGIAYCRAVLMRRVEEREAGVDHDQLARDRATVASREPHAGANRARGVAGGGQRPGSADSFDDLPPNAIRPVDHAGGVEGDAGTRAPISFPVRDRAGGGAR